MIRRREFIGLLGGAAAWPVTAMGQQPVIPVIGYINGSSATAYAVYVQAFIRGLAETGHTVGNNVAIEYSWAEGHYDRIPDMVDDAWADTTTPHGRLMLTVLGGLAEFERELIRARTDEGRKRAQARGVRFGRPLKLTPHQIAEAIARRERGEALAEIGRSYNVSHSTISRL